MQKIENNGKLCLIKELFLHQSDIVDLVISNITLEEAEKISLSGNSSESV